MLCIVRSSFLAKSPSKDLIFVSTAFSTIDYPI
nr:MAG TPA: hypothetical protein [Bacteriophage sp.]